MQVGLWCQVITFFISYQLKVIYWVSKQANLSIYLMDLKMGGGVENSQGGRVIIRFENNKFEPY